MSTMCSSLDGNKFNGLYCTLLAAVIMRFWQKTWNDAKNSQFYGLLDKLCSFSSIFSHVLALFKEILLSAFSSCLNAIKSSSFNKFIRFLCVPWWLFLSEQAEEVTQNKWKNKLEIQIALLSHSERTSTLFAYLIDDKDQ